MRLITAWKVSKYGVISGLEITGQKLLRISTLFTQCMMMTYFSGIIDWRKALTLFQAGTTVISITDHHRESSAGRERDL